MITDPTRTGHCPRWNVLLNTEIDPGSNSENTATPAVTFATLYREQFEFVWRNLRRLGVREDALRDAAQDVFLVAYRKMDGFEGRGTARAWLFSILRRVASDHRRHRRRKALEQLPDIDAVPDCSQPGPERQAVQGESLRLLLRLLEGLDEDKREILVLVDLEGMTVPEAADAVGANLNTAYSRLRFARQNLKDALAQHRTSLGGHHEQ